MDETRFQKWIEIAKALSLDPDSKPLCPACEKSDLQVLDAKVSGSAATYERNIWCEACGARVAVLQRQDRQKRTETTTAAAEQWQRVQARLVGLGWSPQTAEGITGLSSPNDAMFLDARVTETEFRASMISSLGRQVATIQQYREQGFYPPETERAHRDFQQALDCLLEPFWTDKPSAGTGQGLDSRWLRGREDGPVVSDRLPDGRPFLYRDTWVHDALELDPSTRTAVYRDQGHTESDDPRDWMASPVPLRRHSGRWQALVEQTTWERWMQEHESSLASCKKYAAHYPSSLATDQVAGAIRRLEEIRVIGYGWTDLAEDVSAALDEHFVVSEKLHIVGKPDIIDWHDGVLTAVVEVGDDRKLHLCLVLAWSPDYDVRVYGLIPVSDAVASSIRARLGRTPASEENWNEITNALAAAESAYLGLVLVIATESVGKEILGQTAVPSAEIPELRLHANRMGTTYDEARLLFWLERLGVPKPLSWPERDRLRFGHYLETRGPGGEARAAALGITSAVQVALVAEFGELIAMGTPRSKIIACLGEPTFSDARTLRYDLGVRPEYLFEFQLSPDGQAIMNSDYTRRESRELRLRLPTSHADAKLIRARLIELGVTAVELRAAFGEPEDRVGWCPYETWMYPGGLTLELRLGVVEG